MKQLMNGLNELHEIIDLGQKLYLMGLIIIVLMFLRLIVEVYKIAQDYYDDKDNLMEP